MTGTNRLILIEIAVTVYPGELKFHCRSATTAHKHKKRTETREDEATTERALRESGAEKHRVHVSSSGALRPSTHNPIKVSTRQTRNSRPSERRRVHANKALAGQHRAFHFRTSLGCFELGRNHEPGGHLDTARSGLRYAAVGVERTLEAGVPRNR